MYFSEILGHLGSKIDLSQIEYVQLRELLGRIAVGFEGAVIEVDDLAGVIRQYDDVVRIFAEVIQMRGELLLFEFALVLLFFLFPPEHYDPAARTDQNQHQQHHPFGQAVDGRINFRLGLSC